MTEDFLASTALSTSPQPASAEIKVRHTFRIDERDFIYNGDSVFHLSDALTVIRQNQTPPNGGAPVYIIALNFAGTSIGMPFADMSQRDAIFDKLVERFVFIKTVMFAEKHPTYATIISENEKA